MCGLQLTSNYPIVLTDEQSVDTGFIRRINFSKMPRVFLPSEQKNVKGPINAGKMNPELLWIVRRFYPYIKAQKTSRILPRPPRIIRQTEELLSHRVSTLISKFLEVHSEPATYVEADSVTEFTDRMMAKFSLSKTEWISLQVKVGLQQRESGGSGRVFVFHFPGASKFQGIKLCDTAAEADSGM